MGMISEFKEFAMKGSLVDMAVGFVMGAAFTTVVTSFINDIFMPLISPLTGGMDIGSWKIKVTDAVLNSNGEVVTAATYAHVGQFVNALISFLIVALVMFWIIKGMNKAFKKADEAPEAPPANEVLLAEIRDLLAKKK